MNIIMGYLPRHKKFFVLVITTILVVGAYFGYKKYISGTSTVGYQTTTVGTDTFVSSISVSGNISSGNTTSISTKASGTVTKVYVKNGEKVTKGQKVLEISLDADGVERRSSAWSEYLKAQEAVVAAVKNKNDLEIQIWKDKQAILDAESAKSNKATNLTDSESNQIDLAVIQKKQAFDVTAEEFKNADAKIADARVQASASYRDYLDVSGTILASGTGIINNITLTEGSTLTASTNQSTSTGSTYASSQAIGYIRSDNNEYLAKVSLTESDVVKVKAGQRVTLTLDAYNDKTFTGRVLAVDVGGSTNSGVTSYPATIVMDATDLEIYPNMSVSAKIILETATDVLTVPNSSITNNSDGTKSVKLLNSGDTPVTTTIAIGSSNDTVTIVKSGLNEGDKVVTSSTTSDKNNNTTSAFSSSNRQNSSNNSRGSSSNMMIGGPGF